MMTYLFRMAVHAFVFVLIVMVLCGCTEEDSHGDVKVSAIAEPEVVHVLVVGDPFVTSMYRVSPEIQRRYGIELRIEKASYEQMRQKTLNNARLDLSKYHIISFDVLWLGEYHNNNVLLNLDTFKNEHRGTLKLDDFMPQAMRQCEIQGALYGLPIQPHSELLWYRKDLFEARGIEPPQTIEDLLEIAQLMHDPENGFSGICWNALHGAPLGQTVAHLYAAFGQPSILDPHGRPNLNTEAGVQVGVFLKELMKYSPRDIQTMAWNHRIIHFKDGRAAMTYGWGARSYMVEHDARSKVRGKVGYVAAPFAKGEQSHTPLGTWALGIPSNIGDRRALAERALLVLNLPEVSHEMALAGNGGSQRLSLLRDPELQKRYPTYPLMIDLSQTGQLDWRMRPALPIWHDLEQLLGHVYSKILTGEYTPEEAAVEAQRQASLLNAS